MKLRFLYRAWKARLRDQKLEIAIARALIRPGDLVVDAGANKGAYLYWLRRSAGPEGTVFGYEPQPALVKYLEAIKKKLGWENVEVLGVALSDKVGKATLHVPGRGVSPGASLESSVLQNNGGSTFECPVDTLDHQLGGRAPLRFLKVDVEGHELSLFKGAEKVLRSNKPPILFECEARHLSTHKMQDVFYYLENLGYKGYLLAGDRLLPATQFDQATHQANDKPRFWDAPDYYNNFLFVSENLPGELNQYLCR